MGYGFRRHHLVWLDPAHPGIVAADTPTLATARAWLAAGRPCVVRRREATESPEILALGLPLPPRLGRHRLALRAPVAALVRHARPPALAEVGCSLPGPWRQRSQALETACAGCGADLRVYGSCAWEWLTGERYIASGSDLDVLVVPDGAAGAVLGALAAEASAAGPRLDGEIVLPDGGCVAWRELIGRGREILVKDESAVTLRRRDEVASALGIAH